MKRRDCQNCQQRCTSVMQLRNEFAQTGMHGGKPHELMLRQMVSRLPLAGDGGSGNWSEISSAKLESPSRGLQALVELQP